MRSFLYNFFYNYGFIVVLIIIGRIYKRKNIKAIKLFNFDIIYILIILISLFYLTVAFIVPIPSYYIKAKDQFIIEEVIENEMIDSGIEFDSKSLRIINAFLGKSNQLYLCRYENDGIEEARMFDFKHNFFGNLKPTRDFNLSTIILKEDNKVPDRRYSGHRMIREGLSTYFISYGYSNEPIFKDARVGDFRINSLTPEGYYLISERYNNTTDIIVNTIFIAIMIIIIILGYKAEKKKDFYKVVKIQGVKREILVIEYFVEKHMTR